MAGGTRARKGIGMALAGVWGEGSWTLTARTYRKLLYAVGKVVSEQPAGAGFDPQAVAAVLDAGGKLSLPDLLRCRVRYFTDGLALGSQAFVDDLFNRYRPWFGARRRVGALPLRQAPLPHLAMLRNVRRPVALAQPALD